MAEEAQQDRTEKATPKRREDARKKGDVARSRELTITSVMIFGAAALLLMSESIGSRLLASIADALVIERAQMFDESYMLVAFADMAGGMLVALMPFGVVLIITVFLSAVAIGGWSFSMKAAAPKLERISPIKGIKRVFSANALNELVKALAKFCLVAAIAIAWMWYSIDELAGLGREPSVTAIVHALKICGISLLVISSGLVLIAAIDVPIQLWLYEKKLRMTKQQVKDEFKDTEGRPEVKSRIRAAQMQAATRRMMEELPGADVIITNPTHFAVALKYDDAKMSAPRVVAKGKDLVAQRIREVAAEHKVPLFEAPPLARVLYRTTEIGHEIPAKLYSAVAQILAYIYQIGETLAPGQRRLLTPVPDINEDEF